MSTDTEEAICADCAKRGVLWEDPHFGPDPLKEAVAGEQWLRPSEIYKSPVIFAADGMPPGGVCLVPGKGTDDGWLMGALATLAARRPSQLHRLFLSVRGRRHGVFHAAALCG